MTLKHRLRDALHHINQSNVNFSRRTILPLIDLTLLDEQAKSAHIEALATKAAQNHVAAICVLPSHLPFIPESLAINCATVINFPSGNKPTEQILMDILYILNINRTNEIDYVFPYERYIKGQEDLALDSCQRCYQLCKQHNIIFKVILETAAFPSLELIYNASKDVINVGCDFLKTSTGKTIGGASITAAFSMLSAIADTKKSCGIKLSGGIKKSEQAIEYIKLAEHMLSKDVDNSWFRIGASSLLDEILNEH